MSILGGKCSSNVRQITGIILQNCHLKSGTYAILCKFFEIQIQFKFPLENFNHECTNATINYKGLYKGCCTQN